MEKEFWLEVLKRTLPAVVVFGLAYIVAADKKSRERWAEWMYQLGNIRNDQRSDPKVQNGVRLPIFIVSALLLIIPIRYYWYLKDTRNVKFVPQGIVVPRKIEAPATAPTAGGTPEPTATAAPVSSGPIGIK